MRIHVRALAWLYIVTCGLILTAGIVICVGLARTSDAESRKALQFIGPPVLIAAVIGLIPGLVGGIGLLRLRNWARILILILSAFLVPMLPVGSAVGIYGFWTLLNPETKLLFSGSENTDVRPSAPGPSPTINLLGVSACVAAAMFLIIKIGFAVHRDPQPAPIDSPALTGTAAMVCIVGAALAMRYAARSGSKARAGVKARRDAKARLAANVEARRLRVAELAADPKRARYAQLVERGEDWSDENIAYYESPDRTITCSHLEMIEGAMRSGGIQAYRYRETDVSAKCRIDYDALQRQFSIIPPVRYAEFLAGDAKDHELPMAFLICDEHKSMIHTIHPDEPRAQEAPRFPPEAPAER